MTAVQGSATQLMDGIYRYQRYIYDVTRAYYLLGRNRLIETLNVPAGGTVLEIGCGTGRNLIAVARRYPGADLLGFDISGEMLKTATTAITRRQLGPRIRLAQADATRFDAQTLFGRSDLDRIYISYTLSMVPAWRDVVANALRHLKPDSSLHIVDFGEFEGYPAIFRTAQLAWLKRFHVTPIADFEAELQRVCDAHNCKVSVDRLYGGYAVLAEIRRR